MRAGSTLSKSIELVREITSYLRRHPNALARDIAELLNCERGEGNAVLYAMPNRFRQVGEPPPWWFVIDEGEDKSMSYTAGAGVTSTD